MAKIFFVLSFDSATAEGLPSAHRTDRESTPSLRAQYQEPPRGGDQMWSVLECQCRANIEQLTDAHTKHWPRYPMTTSAPIALIYQFEPDATELFEAVNAGPTWRAALFRWPRIKSLHAT